MSFYAILNLAWGIAGSIALLGLFVSSRVHLARSCSPRRFLPLVSVFLVFIALFPYISASDDFIRFEYLQNNTETNSNAGEDGKSKTRLSLQFLRLIESLDNLRVSTAADLYLALFFIEFVTLLTLVVRRRYRLCPISRAPPCPSFLG